MTSVLLDSIEVQTDPYAGMSTVSVGYVDAIVQWQNPSDTTATFRVVAEDGSLLSTETEVGSNNTHQHVLFMPGPLGTSTKAYLERYEIDTWIRQTSTTSLDYVLISKPTTNMTITSGSTTAKVTFPTPVDATYYVAYGVTNRTENRILATTSGSAAEVLITGLTEGQTYMIGLFVMFPQHAVEHEFNAGGEQGDFLHETTFSTSSNAEMVVTGPFASYMVLDWSASVDGQGSNYRIVNRVSTSDDVLAVSSTQTTATIQDLQPGSEYRVVLQRLELDGSWSDQNEIIANTLISSLSLTSIASQTLELNWTSLYAGATFEIMYGVSGGNLVGGGSTQELSTILRDLKAGTTYDLQLVVYELGQAVGLARLGMTTKEGLSSKLAMGAVAIIVVLIIMKLAMKKTR